MNKREFTQLAAIEIVGQWTNARARNVAQRDTRADPWLPPWREERRDDVVNFAWDMAQRLADAAPEDALGAEWE